MTTIRPRFCYIGLDETAHWRIPSKLLPYVARIYGIYVFNRSEHTHCCELTPSHWLECVDFEWAASDAFNALPERECDDIAEAVRGMLLDAPTAESSHYRHVAHVDRLIESGSHRGFHEAGDLSHILDDDDLNDPSTVLNVLMEYWHANPRF